MGEALRCQIRLALCRFRRARSRRRSCSVSSSATIPPDHREGDPTMNRKIRDIALGTAAVLGMSGVAQNQPADPRDHATGIVLVHGAFADGPGWRGIADGLTARGER